MASYDFSGRTAIVTGAASGFGAATTRRLAASGASVLATDRDEEGLAATVAIISENGGSCASIAVDLLDDGAPTAIVDTALGLGDTLDLLVNVAGIWEPAPFGEVTAESFDRHLGINLRAPFLLTQAVRGRSAAHAGGLGGCLYRLDRRTAGWLSGLVGVPDLEGRRARSHHCARH